MSEIRHSTCKYCDLDIEGPHENTLQTKMPNMAWLDRGGNYMCHDNSHEGYFHLPHDDWTERGFESGEPGEIPLPDDVRVVIRNKCRVEAIKNGVVVGKAVRGDVQSSWHVGGLDERGAFREFAEIYNWTPEVLGRKMVLALLRELI